MWDIMSDSRLAGRNVFAYHPKARRRKSYLASKEISIIKYLPFHHSMVRKLWLGLLPLGLFLLL